MKPARCKLRLGLKWPTTTSAIAAKNTTVSNTPAIMKTMANAAAPLLGIMSVQDSVFVGQDVILRGVANPAVLRSTGDTRRLQSEEIRSAHWLDEFGRSISVQQTSGKMYRPYEKR